MARSKPNPHIVASREQAEGTMAEIAALDRKLTALTVSMNKEFDAAKEKAAQAAAPLAARRKELECGLAVFATLNRKELFPDGAKSLDLGFGTIGFRCSTKIVQQNNITSEMTLERLHQFDFLDGIRTKEEINKDAMTTWTDEKLGTVGLRRQKSDGFFVEVKEDTVPS
mgnify:CR=1 FL=1